jgi:alpha-aminoadipate/glutamate carrier protein LysW
MIKCSECDAEIKIPSDAMENEIVTCPDCGASYELIKSNNGFAIRPAQSVGEDWGE